MKSPENFGSQESPEVKVVSLLKDEYERLSKVHGEPTPDDLKFLEEKGIFLDSGDIIIETEGKKIMIITKSDDFGTHVSSEYVIKTYGKEKLKELGMPEEDTIIYSGVEIKK